MHVLNLGFVMKRFNLVFLKCSIFFKFNSGFGSTQCFILQLHEIIWFYFTFGRELRYNFIKFHAIKMNFFGVLWVKLNRIFKSTLLRRNYSKTLSVFQWKDLTSLKLISNVTYFYKTIFSFEDMASNFFNWCHGNKFSLTCV